MKRDLRKAEEEEKCREKANNRDQWKQITKVSLLRIDNYTSITPTQGKPEEEQEWPRGLLPSAPARPVAPVLPVAPVPPTLPISPV